MRMWRFKSHLLSSINDSKIFEDEEVFLTSSILFYKKLVFNHQFTFSRIRSVFQQKA